LAAAQLRIRLRDLRFQIFRQISLEDHPPHPRSALFEIFDVLYVKTLKRGRDGLPQSRGINEMPVGISGRGKTVRDQDAARLELAEHLAERGVLAADGLDILEPQPAERNAITV